MPSSSPPAAPPPASCCCRGSPAPKPAGSTGTPPPTRTCSTSGPTASSRPFEAANPGVTLNLVDAGDAPGNIAIGERALAALAAKADPQADYFEVLRPAPALRRHRRRPLRQPQGSRPLQLVEDQPAGDRHRLFGALPRQPGAARLRHRQAQARGRAEDLRRPHRLDQGQPRPVHLQPPRQGRLRRQLRPPRHLRGERQGPGQIHRRQLHRRDRRGGAEAGLGSARRPRARRSSTRAPTPRATPSRSSSSASPPSP